MMSTKCQYIDAPLKNVARPLVISPLAMTRMACPPALMELEAALVKALDAADGMMASQLVLAIFDRDGLLQVTLTRRDAD